MIDNDQKNEAKHAMKASKFKLDSVELELVKKYRGAPPKTLKELKKLAKEKAKFGIVDDNNLLAEGYTGNYIKKKALVD